MPVLLVTSMCYKSISSLCKLGKCYKYVSKPYNSLSKKNASNQGREWGLIRKGIRKDKGQDMYTLYYAVLESEM